MQLKSILHLINHNRKLTKSSVVVESFSETETSAKKQVSRHETRQDICGQVKIRRDMLKIKMFSRNSAPEKFKRRRVNRRDWNSGHDRRYSPQCKEIQ